jgi:transcriptional regulator with XRE-family HTH domain
MDTEHNNDLGARIRVIRKAKRLTQSELAERVGLESKSVSRIETGVYEPSLTVLRKLAKGLDVSPREFFNESRSTTTPTSLRELRHFLTDFVYAADESALLRLYKETL